MNHYISSSAFELKRSYQKHLGQAVVISAVLHLAIIGGFLLYSKITDRVSVPKVIRIKTIAELQQIQVPSITQQNPKKKQGQKSSEVVPQNEEQGIPEPVPDEEVPPEPKEIQVSIEDWGDGDDSVVIEIPPEEPRIDLAGFFPRTARLGETIEFTVKLRLVNEADIAGISCLLSSDHPYTTILQGMWDLNGLFHGPFTVRNSQSPFKITFGADIPPAYRDVMFKLNINVDQPEYSWILDVGPLTLRPNLIDTTRPIPIDPKVETLIRWKFIPKIQGLRTGKKITSRNIGPNVKFRQDYIAITYEGKVYQITYHYEKFAGPDSKKLPINELLEFPPIPQTINLGDIIEFFLQECKKEGL